MNALSIANYIVNNWSDKIEITNLKLNKLVYYSYVESLRKLGPPVRRRNRGVAVRSRRAHGIPSLFPTWQKSNPSDKRTRGA